MATNSTGSLPEFFIRILEVIIKFLIRIQDWLKWKTLRYFGGFILRNLYYDDNLEPIENSFLNILEMNDYHIEVPSGEPSTSIPLAENEIGKTSLGWFFKLNTTESSTTPGERTMQPVQVMQLIMTTCREQNVTTYKFSQESIDFQISAGNPPSPPNLNYTQHQIFVDNSKYHHNFLGEISEIELKMCELEFYEKETEVVFFSRSQLLMIKRLIEQMENTGVKSVVIFSGYHLNIGRTAVRASMNELEVRRLQNTRHDAAERFSLKAEVIPINELDIYAEQYARANQNNSPQAPPDDSVLDSIGFRTITNNPDPKKFDVDLICEQLENGDIPTIFLGQPCPPAWEIIAEVLEEIANLRDGNNEDVNWYDAICDLLREMFPEHTNNGNIPDNTGEDTNGD